MRHNVAFKNEIHINSCKNTKLTDDTDTFESKVFYFIKLDYMIIRQKKLPFLILKMGAISYFKFLSVYFNHLSSHEKNVRCQRIPF